MREMARNPGKMADRVGACASTLCAVHCLLTGVAMGSLAVLGLGFMAHPAVELGFLGIAFAVGIVAFVHGIRRHHSPWPAAVFVSGLAAIVASHFVGHEHAGGREASALGTVLAVAGGLLVAAFHLVNLRLQHRKCGCVPDPDSHLEPRSDSSSQRGSVVSR